MRDHRVSEDAVHHVIGDADEVLPRHDGRTEYVGRWGGRTFVVILDDDGRTVVTVLERKRRRLGRR